jgi:hypothetical protein
MRRVPTGRLFGRRNGYEAMVPSGCTEEWNGGYGSNAG